MAKFPVYSNPVVVHRRAQQPDLSIPVLQQARESGIAIRQGHLAAEGAAMGLPADPIAQLVAGIKKNTDIELALKIIGLGFIGRVVTLAAATRALLIPRSKFYRGYIIINPAEVSGFSSNVTFFPSATRANGSDTTSAGFNVTGVDTLRAFLDVTAVTLTPTLRIDVQTQDPLTANWATAVTDIFSGNVAVGTYYANVGPLGVDQNVRLRAVVGDAAGDDVTFSVSGVFKGGAALPVGNTVYIGNSEVTATIGYPILPAQREYFWLQDDVELFAISPINPMTLKVFQLQ